MMNAIKVTLLLVLIAAAFPTRAQDWRRVNQTTVNLAPVHDWMKGKRKAERPLAHWQELHLVELKATLHTYDRCVVRFEDGKIIELFVNNLEEAVRTPFVRLREVQARVDQLEASIAADEIRLANLPKRERAALRVSVKQQRQSLKDLRQELASWRKRSEAASRASVLAMFTGGNYAGLPLWDCGVKVDPPKE